MPYTAAMDGSIYDFGLGRLAFQADGRVQSASPELQPDNALMDVPTKRRGGVGLVGLIANPRSHRNSGQTSPWASHPSVIGHAPSTRAELYDLLSMFAERAIDVLAIDGGDGTVRDVLTCAGDIWGAAWPDILLLPTGKTNALAGDLGVPAQWSLDDGLTALAVGKMATRRPLEIVSTSGEGPAIRGFIFGAGAFVDATALAQRTHRAGAFNGIAVGLALTWGVGQTLFGGADSRWRAGRRMNIAYGPLATRMHDAAPDGADERYLLLASTLNRLPLGMKPFGAVRSGLKTLVVDAPPRHLAATIGPLLTGSQSVALEQRGYHRVDADSIAIEIDSNFILDGEIFPPGSYLVREATPLRFVVT